MKGVIWAVMVFVVIAFFDFFFPKTWAVWAGLKFWQQVALLTMFSVWRELRTVADLAVEHLFPDSADEASK